MPTRLPPPPISAPSLSICSRRASTTSCTLRIWAKIDDVWALVAKKLALAADEFAMPPRPFPALPDGSVYALPRYDATGRRHCRRRARQRHDARPHASAPASASRIPTPPTPTRSAKLAIHDEAGELYLRVSQEGQTPTSVHAWALVHQGGARRRPRAAADRQCCSDSGRRTLRVKVGSSGSNNSL
jgi:hypothetical protein